MKRITVIVLAGCLSVGSTGCVNGLFYHPSRTLYQTPAKHHLPFEQVQFQSTDGTKLSGWFVPAVGPPVGTVIHFHGNAQNMSAHFSFVDWLPTNGFNVFVFDYRGYGMSEGHPDRSGVYEDSVSALRYVQSRSDIDPHRLVVFAQSLGAANAVVALSKNHVEGIKALVVDSSFYSYRSIVRDKIGTIPILSLFKWPLSFVVVSDKYSPGDYVKGIAPMPILFIHGTKDPVIPIEHSRKLYQRANEPKQFWIVEGGSHADALLRYREQYEQPLVRFFTDALGPLPSSAP